MVGWIITSVLPLFEARSAKTVIDPYYGIPLDLTALNWPFSVNDAASLPEPFLSRLRVIRIDQPSRADLMVFAMRMAPKTGCTEAQLDMAQYLLDIWLKGHLRASPCGVVQTLSDLAALSTSTQRILN